AKPVLVPCPDADHQAAFVARRALELRERGINLNEMAVLYRSHFHALELQLELTRRNIPFSITSGIRFFEQAHIKDVAAYLKLVGNPSDELSFKRIARMLPGIGGKGADKLWASFQNSQRLTTDRQRPADDRNQPGGGQQSLATDTEPASKPLRPIAEGLQKCTGAVPKKAAVAWAQLTATIAQLEVPPVRGSASQMIKLVLEAVYEDYLKQ